MSELPRETTPDAAAVRPSQTIRLSPEELKAIIAEEQANQDKPADP